MEQKEIEEQLQDACKALLLIPMEDFERHNAECEKSLSDFDAFAPILAPADYFTKRNSGELDFIRVQNEIGRKLLEARRLIESMPMGAKLRVLGAKTFDEILAEGRDE